MYSHSFSGVVSLQIRFFFLFLSTIPFETTSHNSFKSLVKKKFNKLYHFHSNYTTVHARFFFSSSIEWWKLFNPASMGVAKSAPQLDVFVNLLSRFS